MIDLKLKYIRNKEQYGTYKKKIDMAEWNTSAGT